VSDTLLVTGASGQFGRLVVKHLLESQGVAPARIVAASRDPSKLADLAQKGVRTVAADFDDSASLESAFKGVGRVLLISTDALDRPGRRLAQHQAAVDAAKAAGVGHVIYTSMPKAEEALVIFAPDHLGTENALKASGLGYTILRNSWYMENLLGSLPNTVKSGKWFTASGTGRNPYVGREDLARAAAAALAAEDAANHVYTLTGVEALSVDEIAALVSDVVGSKIEVVHVSEDGLKQGLAAAGVPDFFVPVILSIEANARGGKFDVVTDTIEKLTGKAPGNLKAFLEANKDAIANA
jgi:NAD(P)H dehydrogenase (quinone)